MQPPRHRPPLASLAYRLLLLLPLIPIASLLLSPAATVAAAPMQLHPKNPHYFLWRNQTVALVTSGEHYGMVLNRELDYRRYLETLAADGLNYTRIFTGSYVEMVGAFGIRRNTLAPAAGQFLAPWARSGTPGYAGGGNRFDLDRWDPAYFERLRNFVQEAGRRGIVVEVTLFSSIYTDDQWRVNVFHPSNNINGLSVRDRLKVNTVGNGPILAYQEKMVRQIVRELSPYDNVFYEIQNEPWADHQTRGEIINPYLANEQHWPNAVEIPAPVSVEWQARVAAWITNEEPARQRHLIAQNVANFRLPVRMDDLAPGVSIINFHYAAPEAAAWNYGLGKLIGYDESGFCGSADASYRREAWNFMFAGGGLFNSLDYSFSKGHEDGADTAPNGPGGGSPGLRRQLKVLSQFLRTLPQAELRPDPTVVRRSPGAVARALSWPRKTYAIYLRGRSPCELTLDLPPGAYQAEWIHVTTGEVAGREQFKHRGELKTLASPAFEEDIAVVIRKG